MMLSVLLICGAESVQATTNVLTEVVLTPRRLMTDPADCRVIANSAVGRAGADDGLDVTATISAAPAAWGAVGYRPDDWPKVLRPGARHDVVPVTAAVPAGSATVRLAGDIKVTTCTSVGGSRENGSPYLCDPDRVRRGGSALYVALVAAQRAVGGGYCAVRTVASRTVHVDAKTHHAMVAQSGTYRLSGAGKCTRDVTVKVYTRILGGADVVVHRKGSITTVYG
jgi:hypothetical protein